MKVEDFVVLEWATIPKILQIVYILLGKYAVGHLPFEMLCLFNDERNKQIEDDVVTSDIFPIIIIGSTFTTVLWDHGKNQRANANQFLALRKCFYDYN